ncbi:MAG: hypothetical protein AVDCRST_MAG42-388 [uncultured Chthoniobacterales bacterium]|uniref:Peptidase M12B domain-containing protein n=1 Tax=uncultured Chthoniobacterales bacterium TaxID=1836801 RepID=A0A6J4H839_9BACT|nr:MAG: hypothetical protein AVDCRST_MAG42-388 [uncultured Chthoniobacterales bacterium]
MIGGVIAFLKPASPSVCAGLLFLFASAADAAEDNRLLRQAHAAERPDWLAPQLQGETRGRMAHLDMRVLERMAQASGPMGHSAPVALELFEDANFGLTVKQVDSFGDVGRFVIHGTLSDSGRQTSGTALLSVVEGAVQAEVLLEDGRKFTIQQAGGDLCRISEVDPRSSGAECAFQPDVSLANHAPAGAAPKPSSTSTSAKSAMSGEASQAAAEGDAPVVDIMIVYTPALERSLGSRQAVEARAQLGISTANAVFAASEIKARVRLVHTARVEYLEDAEMSVDLWRLADPTDGYMDEVAGLRERYAADVVHLFGSFQDYRRGQATGYPSDNHAVVISGDAGIFVHELGHNFGCQHDRDAAGLNGSSYAFGHVFTAAEDGQRYGCVMSYTGNAGAQRLYHFSNPNISYKGTPTGVPKGRRDSADNARMVDLTAPMLAGFRNADGSSNRMPVFAMPPGVSFPTTPPGSTAVRQNIRLAFAGGSRPRPLRVSDFRLNGDADAFLVEIWDPTARQFITGPEFTIPNNGLTLFVQFRPTGDGTAQAEITFNIDDPAYRYHPPGIRLVGNATAPLLKNVSTRAAVGAGDDALIGGFIVGGDGPRDIIVKAVGPSLATAGVADALADPTVELYRGADLIAENDEWVDGPPRESIKWTGVAPARDLESAVLARLEPGSYTAVVRGVYGATGVGLIEAYDLGTDGATRLLNISTRGQVRPGDGAMIGGFILGGAPPSRVLVRALGPSLSSAGVRGALENPTIEIFDGQGSALAANDDWRSDNQEAIEKTGAAPPDDREAAALLTLRPGAYTAVVRGAGEASGVGLVEVYQLDAQ